MNPAVLHKHFHAIERDVQAIVLDIFRQYDVYYKNSSTRVDLHTVCASVERQCAAATRNGKRCTQQPAFSSMYCKRHRSNEHATLEATPSVHTVDIVPMTTECGGESGRRKVFVDDSFYSIDEMYMYDLATGARVGYIEDGRYMLTDDPFILGESAA